MISAPIYPMSISARAIAAPAAIKIKRENRQDIRTTYRLYKGTFPLLILLAAIPIRFMEVFYHYRAITQGLGPYLLPVSFRHAHGGFAPAQPLLACHMDGKQDRVQPNISSRNLCRAVPG